MNKARLRFPLLGFVFLLFLVITSISIPVQAALDLNLIIHDVRSTPIQGQLAYQIDVYMSVLDASGSAVKELKATDFTVLEDSEPVAFELQEEIDLPLNLLIALDTSGSMYGRAIDNARLASQNFVGRLSAEDQVSVISFNEKITVVSDFTTNHQLVRDSINTIAVKGNVGTCLYDAIYTAVEMVGVLPEGRRAVVVLTDGRDELPNGSPCSTVTLDDVIHLAASSVNTPVYLIGVGKNIDANILERIALLTGGAFLTSTDITQTEALFNTLTDQLQNQYLLSYISTASPGEHTLVVQVNLGGNKDQDSHSFLLSELPPIITIESITNGQIINSPTAVTLAITGNAAAIHLVKFELNGAVVGEDDAAPYEYEIDPSLYEAGTLEIVVKAYDSSGKLLTMTSANANIPVAQPTSTLPGTPALPKTTAAASMTNDEKTKSAEMLSPAVYLGAGGAVLLIVVLGIVLVARSGKQKSSTPSVPEYRFSDDVTIDEPFTDSDIAILRVIASDDPSRVGEKIRMQKNVVTIGRKADNDIVFPKDHPVSREHVRLEYRDSHLLLSEILTQSGQGLKRPTYGTFVNEEQLLSNDAVELKTGDIIRLGNRLKLCVECFAQDAGREVEDAGSQTIDELDDFTID